MRGTKRSTSVRRKHRLYVDVTFSSPVSRRKAAYGLRLVLDDRLDLQAKPVWAYDGSPYIDKLSIKEKDKRG